jgi:hypothetical protein
MGNKIIMDTTTNNSVFNKTRKRYLEDTGELRCSWCPYHGKENFTGNFYWISRDRTKYPSWKLVSKNSKQWMKKPIKMITKKYRRKELGEYIEIVF